MKAIIITQEREPIQLLDVPEPEVDDESCIVKLSSSALNRRDQWIREGKYPGIEFGTVLGSDGCGEVIKGPAEWIHKKVIINPNIDWGDNPKVQSSTYSVLGMPANGALAEQIKVPIHRLHKIPRHLSDEEASALPLAGLTAFRAAIKKGLADQGKKILVTGAGGGVSQLAIDFSLAAGAEVYVTSGEDTKIQRLLKKGVRAGFNYKDNQWFKKAIQAGGFDAIIDSAGGNQFNNYLKIVKPGGRVVIYGSTTGYPEKVDLFRLFWSQTQIMGSTMGNDEEFEEMLIWVEQHQIKPTIDKIYPYRDYLKAFDRFNEPDHMGKIVLNW